MLSILGDALAEETGIKNILVEVELFNSFILKVLSIYSVRL